MVTVTVWMMILSVLTFQSLPMMMVAVILSSLLMSRYFIALQEKFKYDEVVSSGHSLSWLA